MGRWERRRWKGDGMDCNKWLSTIKDELWSLYLIYPSTVINSLIWPFPHRYRHSPWPVGVTELFPWFCCWTQIWLSRHWAWLRRGYCSYRSLIDWLIDWIDLFSLNSIQKSTDRSTKETVTQEHRSNAKYTWQCWTPLNFEGKGRQISRHFLSTAE